MRWLIVLLALVLAAALLARRYLSTGFDLDRFLDSLRRTDPVWLLAAAALSLLSYYGRVVRWAVMLEPSRPHADRGKLFSATVIGFTAIVLFGRPGELVRPYLIARGEQVSFASQMGAWVLERIYDLLFILVLFGFAMALVMRSGEHMGHRLTWVLSTGGWVVGGAGTACILALLLLHQHIGALETRLIRASSALKARHHEKVSGLIRTVLDGVRCVQSRSAVARLFLWSGIEWFIIALIYRTMFLAFPELGPTSWAHTILMLGFVSFGSIVQIPGIGGGVQIVSMLVLTELFQAPLEVATSFALLLWLVTFVIIVPLGMFLAFREGLRWGALRNIQPEATSL